MQPHQTPRAAASHREQGLAVLCWEQIPLHWESTQPVPASNVREDRPQHLALPGFPAFRSRAGRAYRETRETHRQYRVSFPIYDFSSINGGEKKRKKKEKKEKKKKKILCSPLVLFSDLSIVVLAQLL